MCALHRAQLWPHGSVWWCAPSTEFIEVRGALPSTQRGLWFSLWTLEIGTGVGGGGCEEGLWATAFNGQVWCYRERHPISEEVVPVELRGRSGQMAVEGGKEGREGRE